jgi:Sulfotransferase family
MVADQRDHPVTAGTHRSCAPVFVVGSPRSGTTLLYDMLLSAGGFALYLGESSIFNVVAPRFGDLRARRNREKMLEVWLGSRLFRVSGLGREEVENKILSECRNPGDFLRIVMDALARKQNAQRWAGNTPEEILYLPFIKQTIPNALFIHVLRDGRDVALSLSRRRYIRPFPWKERETTVGAAIYWAWIVERGRRLGQELGADYTEIHFEQLVAEPQIALARLSSFLDHALDYERIQRVALGSVAKPNTSFKTVPEAEFNPVGRWKEQLTPRQLTRIEGLIGATLTDLGYPLVTPGKEAGNRLELAGRLFLYRRFFDLKLRWKNSAIVRLFRPELTSHEVDEIVIADEMAAAKLGSTSVQVP